jgi:hypothetical protein
VSTSSLVGVLQIIRTRLLSFTPTGGTTLAVQLGSTASGAGSDGKLYLNQAPDDVTGFWGVLRLINAPQEGMDGGLMLRCEAELILYGQGRRYQSQVERMADTVEQAWLWYGYAEVNGTIIAGKITNRFPIPFQTPADRELVAIRLVLPFRTTPQFLVQYADT